MSSSSSSRRLLLLSNSTLHPTGYLEYAQSHITDFLNEANVKRILFVPYALADHDDYTATANDKLGKWGFKVEGIHTFPDPKEAVRNAQAIFIGGGNTFRLLKKLYDNGLVTLIRCDTKKSICWPS
jgi:dipeptidase E